MKGEGRPSSSRAAVLQPRRRKGERERDRGRNRLKTGGQIERMSIGRKGIECWTETFVISMHQNM